jgi:hypothetical protein
MYRNRAAAPIVATVIEKMLSTALYWNTDRSGIAAPSKQKPSIIASPVFNVVLETIQPLRDLGDGHQSHQPALSSGPLATDVFPAEILFTTP